MTSPTEVGARLLLEGRQQFTSDARAAGQAVSQIGTEAEQAASKAQSAGKRFGIFSREVKTSGIAASKSLGVVGANAGVAFGDGFTRDSMGRLRNSQGKFVSEGRAMGRNITTGAMSETRKAPPGILGSMGRGLVVSGSGAGRRFGTAFRESALTYVKTIGASMIGFFAAEKIKQTLTDSVAIARQANAQEAITAQVIKTTGGAANVSASYVDNLTKSISNHTGVLKEEITTSANMLLTFKSVRNEVGKGNNIFDRATKTANDMSVALGQSAKSSALQLGKALNDPVKGITALRRVGVQFTASQTAMITKLVASGHTLKAQKIILGELHSEFGGAAKASTSAGKKLSNMWHNTEEQIGKKIIPVLDKLERWFMKTGLPGIERAAGWLSKKLKPVFHDIGAIIEHIVVPALKAFGGWINRNKGWIVPLVKYLGLFLGILKLYRFTVGIVTGVTYLWTAAQGALNIMLDANPIGLIIIAIAALTTGIIYAYKHVTWFRNLIQGAGRVIAGIFDFIKQHWRLFATYFVTIMTGGIAGAIIFVITHFDRIKSVASTVARDVVGFFKAIPHALAHVASDIWHWITWPFVHGWNAISNFFSNVTSGFSNLPKKIQMAIATLVNILTWPFRTVYNLIARMYNDTLGKVRFTVPHWVPKIGGDSWGFPQMPYVGAIDVSGIAGDQSKGQGNTPVPHGGSHGNALALGGPANAGRSYLVGENGPEIFQPSENGRVLPNARVRTHGLKARMDNSDMVGPDDGSPLVVQLVVSRKVLAETAISGVRAKAARS